MQVVEAKLPMLGPAEKTWIKNMIYERQSDRGTTDVRMDNAASTSPVGVFHQICNDDLTMSGICHTSMEAWENVAYITGAIYHCWTRSELHTRIQNYFPNTWSIYKDLQYPSNQRDQIDINCILWLCGGMYIDRHVMPNRQVYYQVPFVACRMPRMKTTKKHITKGFGRKRCSKTISTTLKYKRPTAKRVDQ